jgi:chitinase
LTVRAFDCGGSHEMTDTVINVIELTHKQINELRKDFNDTQVYASTGMILMNGHIDKASEMFSLDNFKKLIDYANEKNLGRVSFWALNRDRPCGSDVKGWVSSVYSSVT